MNASRLMAAVAAACLLSTTAPPAVGRADAIPQRTLSVRWQGGVPRIRFAADELITASVRRKLLSGLPQTIAVQVYAYREGRPAPLAVRARVCRVAYDLWEQLFRIRVAEGEPVAAHTIDEVVRRCLVFRDFSVGRSRDYRPLSRVYFATSVEFNPVSAARVARIRRWLARAGERSGTEAFFGSFVSLFVNQRIGRADYAIRFRSQTVEVP